MSGKINYIKVARIDQNGVDLTETLESLSSIVLPFPSTSNPNKIYQILSRSRFNTYYLFFVNQINVNIDVPDADTHSPQYIFDTPSMTHTQNYP